MTQIPLIPLTCYSAIEKCYCTHMGQMGRWRRRRRRKRRKRRKKKKMRMESIHLRAFAAVVDFAVFEE